MTLAELRMPAEVPVCDIPPSGRLDEFLVDSGVCKSKSAARRLIEQGAVTVYTVRVDEQR